MHKTAFTLSIARGPKKRKLVFQSTHKNIRMNSFMRQLKVFGRTVRDEKEIFIIMFNVYIGDEYVC